jgi:YegS/Rv2252/BmrU family lipid kinase
VKQKRALIILNPVSGTRDAGEIRAHIEDSMENAGWAYDIVETKPDIEIAALTRESSPEAYDLVVAAGGDGTVAGVASTLVHSGKLLGIVPVGTGNALARDLGIPLDPKEAANLLTGPHGARDLTVLRVGDAHYLLNVSAGVSAATMKGTERSAKQTYGIVAYVLDALKQIGNARSVGVTVEVDGEKLETHATEVAVLNGGLLGPETLSNFTDLNIAEHDAVVAVVQADSVPDYISAAWNMLTKRSDSDPQVLFMPVKDRVSIRPHEPIPFQADGEPLDVQEVTVHILPRGVRVLTIT